MDNSRKKIKQRYLLTQLPRRTSYRKHKRKTGGYLKPPRIDFKVSISRITNNNGESLLQYLSESDDFPDFELAKNIEFASDEFRKNFKLRYN